MICLRCGYCCIYCDVVIIKPEFIENPDLTDTDTFMIKEWGRECPHFSWEGDNKASCAVHHLPWYKETPCHRHGQIERSPNNECRMGRYQLDRGGVLETMKRRSDGKTFQKKAQQARRKVTKSSP